jgi:hypothetical protein
MEIATVLYVQLPRYIYNLACREFLRNVYDVVFRMATARTIYSDA